MSSFKPFRAADYVPGKSQDYLPNAGSCDEHHDVITAILHMYPNGDLRYGKLIIGVAGNSFEIKRNENVDPLIDVEVVKKIDSILNEFGLRSKRSVNHNTGLSTKYLIVKITDA